MMINKIKNQKLDLNKPLQTRSGIKVIAHHLFDLDDNSYPLICMLENEPMKHFSYTRDGKYSITDRSHHLDLVNVPEPDEPDPGIDYREAYCELYIAIAKLLTDNKQLYLSPSKLLQRWDIIRNEIPYPFDDDILLG